MKQTRYSLLNNLLTEGHCPNCFNSQIIFQPPSIGSEVVFKCIPCGWWDTLTWEEINLWGGKLPS